MSLKTAKKKIALGVNIDHVATLRQARGGRDPEIAVAAGIVKRCGADGITIHLREDRRHIQDQDVYIIRRLSRTMLNLEMSLSPEIIRIALDVMPDLATVVPEKRQELTTEGGLDVVHEFARVTRAVKRLHQKGIRVSLFIDPDTEQVRKSAESGADAIELHTGSFAESFARGRYKSDLAALKRAAREAHRLGLGVNAGHGLNYDNVHYICQIPYIEELNIGHAIIAESVFCGLGKAVAKMRRCIRGALA
jgi:pyridoxine 5-phosphate synthase